MIGNRGDVLSFDGSSFAPITVQGLPSTLGSDVLKTSWVHAKRNTVWACNGKTLVELDLTKKQAKVHKSKLFFDVESIHGVETKSGLLLALGTFGKVALYDGTDWWLVHKGRGNRLWMDGSKAQIYVADPFDFKVFDVHHPWLGTGTSPKLQ